MDDRMTDSARWALLKQWALDRVRGSIKETGTSLYFKEMLEKMTELEYK